MIDKICLFLTNRIRKEMPEIDDERAEAINYGLQNIIGEFPKIFIVFIVAYFLGIMKETLMVFLILMPYRTTSGGFHLKTHLGCIICTCSFYCVPAYISNIIVLPDLTKYIMIFLVWIFGMWMIKLYAPADTENVPILRKKDRKMKRNLSYIFFSIGLIVSLFISNNTISNMIIFGYFIQTLTITRFSYRLTNNKYGYEVYQNT